MKFGQFKIDEAQGCILAHTVRAAGQVFKKGICLGEADLAALRDAGIETISAVRLELGDVAEDTVARLLAERLCGENVRIGTALAGRCNVYALRAGLVDIERQSIDCINQAGYGVLIATLNPFEVVEPGRTIATIKVAPYALSKDQMDELLRCSQSSSVLSVHGFVPRKVGLVLSHAPGQKESLLDKAREVIAARLESYGSVISQERRCAHLKEDVSAAIIEVSKACDVVMILGAASPCDIADVVPAAMVKAGATVDVFGIPVDPGNLMVSGRLEGKTILGLPGCARSPALNGVDLVFARLSADQDVSPQTLHGLGVGGLLGEISERPQAREAHRDAPRPVAPKQGVKRLAAVVLAAGSSRRMGDDNKLLSSWNDKPLVRHAVETALASQAQEVVVVTGYDAANVRQALTGLDVRFVHNPHFGEGLSTSLRTGIGALGESGEQCDGAVIMLGDMPRLQLATLDQLIMRFVQAGGQNICVPNCQGRRGNPVVWPSEYFCDILNVTGDRGARALLKQYAAQVIEVSCDDL
ncbi:MAG: molybdopterin-binding/glycosyltransferase family 2 protein, partial [Magnetovibrio sp.]|nr:molybdopterin-binding/glycosyltransferase family 2 protein [Magnetovibrio sp.]